MAILYPAVAMFGLTFGLMIYLGLARNRAIRRGEVRLAYYRTYDKGEQTPRLHLLTRHVQNHFEVPPLFYVAVILTFVANAVTPLSVTLAWLYVGARCVHSGVHLGSNNVLHRFYVFGFSLLCLAGLWLALLYSLMTSG